MKKIRYWKGKPIQTFRMKDLHTNTTFEGTAIACAEFVKNNYPERISGYFDGVPNMIRAAAKRGGTYKDIKVEMVEAQNEKM